MLQIENFLYSSCANASNDLIQMTIHIRLKSGSCQAFLNLYHLVRATDKMLSKNCHMYECVTRVTKFGNYHFSPCHNILSQILTLGIHLVNYAEFMPSNMYFSGYFSNFMT